MLWGIEVAFAELLAPRELMRHRPREETTTGDKETDPRDRSLTKTIRAIHAAMRCLKRRNDQEVALVDRSKCNYRSY
jgi:hypothetical protein